MGRRLPVLARPPRSKRFTLAGIRCSLPTSFDCRALLSSIAPLAFGAGKSIVFASAADVIDSSHGAWLRLIYTEACRRLGYDFELRPYPTRRAAAMSDSGTV